MTLPTPLNPIPIVTASCVTSSCRPVYTLAVGGLLVAYLLWGPYAILGLPMPRWSKWIALAAAFVGVVMALVVMLWACPACGVEGWSTSGSTD